MAIASHTRDLTASRPASVVSWFWISTRFLYAAARTSALASRSILSTLTPCQSSSEVLARAVSRFWLVSRMMASVVSRSGYLSSSSIMRRKFSWAMFSICTSAWYALA